MSDYVEVKGVKVRVGDRVRWVGEGVVDYVDARDPSSPFCTRPDGFRWWVDAKAIQSIEVLPPAIKVGDWVSADSWAVPLKVLATLSIDERDWLICESRSSSPLSILASLCTKAPA
jgi:hypothetical protein